MPTAPLPFKPTPRRLAFMVLLLAALGAVLWQATRAPVVDGTTLHATELVRSVQFSGRVATLARVDVGSTLTARVAQVLVREGASVRAGAGVKIGE